MRIHWRKTPINCARRGFSLIELLVSVAILGVLSTLAVPNLVRAHYKGRAARIADDLRVLRDTFDQYHMTAGERCPSPATSATPPPA